MINRYTQRGFQLTLYGIQYSGLLYPITVTKVTNDTAPYVSQQEYAIPNARKKKRNYGGQVQHDSLSSTDDNHAVFQIAQDDLDAASPMPCPKLVIGDQITDAEGFQWNIIHIHEQLDGYIENCQCERIV